MIHEVDEALRRLVKGEALGGAEVEVVLDAPSREWAARRSAPAVDLYLYDIREDTRRRTTGLVEERDGDGRVVGRHAPPRWLRLAYLVTAWTQRPEDEHRLLSALLACFLHEEQIPAPYLVGSLAEEPTPPALSVAQPPPDNHQVSDVWAALGGELKASLDLVVSVAVDPRRMQVPAPPVLEPLRARIVGPDGLEEERQGSLRPDQAERVAALAREGRRKRARP